MAWPGEKAAWDVLAGLEARDITARAGAVFNSGGSTYTLSCLGQDIGVSLKDRDIFSHSDLGKQLVNAQGGYSRLSILNYLIHATDLPLSGRWVQPSDLPGGAIFVKGTHVLPMDKLAARYSNNEEAFFAMGKNLGGSRLDYGDMSVKMLPFPRVPVVLIVWSGDEEFPPRASLLFDSSCVSHLATDVIWSTAMMTVEMMAMNS